ncbi:MAG: LysE family transporter [Alphaproteobacteria bacterium]|nr:LysE family transporter [Alphaproteobacteria bacterium]
MLKHVRLFTTAFGISFVGAIPIGTLNTSVANYVLNYDPFGALWFALGAILVEVVLVRLAVEMIGRLEGLQKLFRILSFMMCLGILVLSYKTLEAALHMKTFQDVVPFVGMNPFLSGLFLSLINPLHLPFWLGWTAVLKRRDLLKNKAAAYNVYILGIGMGTAFSFLIYGFAGKFFMELFTAGHTVINWVLGITLLVTGLVIAYKLINRQIKFS